VVLRRAVHNLQAYGAEAQRGVKEMNLYMSFGTWGWRLNPARTHEEAVVKFQLQQVKRRRKEGEV